jgi:hypothetical protein
VDIRVPVDINAPAPDRIDVIVINLHR